MGRRDGGEQGLFGVEGEEYQTRMVRGDGRNFSSSLLAYVVWVVCSSFVVHSLQGIKINC